MTPEEIPEEGEIVAESISVSPHEAGLAGIVRGMDAFRVEDAGTNDCFGVKYETHGHAASDTGKVEAFHVDTAGHIAFNCVDSFGVNEEVNGLSAADMLDACLEEIGGFDSFNCIDPFEVKEDGIEISAADGVKMDACHLEIVEQNGFSCKEADCFDVKEEVEQGFGLPSATVDISNAVCCNKPIDTANEASAGGTTEGFFEDSTGRNSGNDVGGESEDDESTQDSENVEDKFDERKMQSSEEPSSTSGEEDGDEVEESNDVHNHEDEIDLAYFEGVEIEYGSDEEVSKGPIRSINEVEALPPVSMVEVQLEPHHQTLPVGRISSIIGEKVIVEGSEAHNPLNEGSILWITESRTPLGLVDELFGPVKNPYYCVRYNSEKDMPPGISVGTAVSFVPEFADHILNLKDLQSKGYDASGENDEEHMGDMEFSDDEQEAEYRKSLKQAKRPNDEQCSAVKNRFHRKADHQGKARGLQPISRNGGSPNSPGASHGRGGTFRARPYPALMQPPTLHPPSAPSAFQFGGNQANPVQQMLLQQNNAPWPTGFPPLQQNLVNEMLASSMIQGLLLGVSNGTLLQQQQQQQQQTPFGNAPPPQHFMPSHSNGIRANSPWGGSQQMNPPFLPGPLPMWPGNFGNAQQPGFSMQNPNHGPGGMPPAQFNVGSSSFGSQSPRGRGGRGGGRGRGRRHHGNGGPQQSS